MAKPRSLQLSPGDVFGQWTVLDEVTKQYKGQTRRYARCRCTCGTERELPLGQLMSGGTTKCKSCAVRAASRFPRVGGLQGWYWTRLLHNAENRGLEVLITQEDAWRQFEHQGGRCALTGLALVLPTEQQRASGSASLDRIDPAQGYVHGNIQWVHKEVNQMKMDLTEARFVELCCLIADQRGKLFEQKPAGPSLRVVK